MLSKIERSLISSYEKELKELLKSKQSVIVFNSLNAIVYSSIFFLVKTHFIQIITTILIIKY